MVYNVPYVLSCATESCIKDMSFSFNKLLQKKEMITGLVSGVILLAFGWPLGFYNPIDLIPKIARKILDVIMSTLSTLNTTFPLWYTLITLFLIIFSKKFCAHLRDKQNTNNSFLQYREDVFNDVKYKWRYRCAKKQYSIVDIQAYCSNCGCPLPVIECPNPECKKFYLERPMGDHVMSSLVALIKHRLATIYKIDEYEKIK